MTSVRAALAAALAALAVYWGTLDNGFVWDDRIHIESAPFMQDPANARVLLRPGFWTGALEVEGSARPVLLVSLLADRALWGKDPAGYHLTNVLLHGAVAAMATTYAAALTASPPLALVAGLLTAVHPAASEAVCGVTFRADLLAALFGLLALLARRRARGQRAAAWLAAAAAAFALALLSKESAAAFAALAALDELLFPIYPRRARPRLVQAAVFLLVLAAYAAFRAPRGGYAAISDPPAASAPAAPVRATRHHDQSPPPWREALKDPGARARTMLGVLLDYARLTLYPASLQADRTAPVVASWADARAWGGVLVLAVALGLGWALRRTAPAASLGLLWFLTALLPVSGLAPLANLIAERYLYLPLVGAALAAAALLERATRAAPHSGAAFAVTATLLLLPAAARTRARVPDWRGEDALFGGPLETDGPRLRYNRGLAARAEGRLDAARREYEKALEFDPRSVEALVNLAEVALAQGRTAEELALLGRAVAAAPRSSVAHEALAEAYARRGRAREALESFRLAVGAESRSARARRGYAAALALAGRGSEALREAEIAARLDPGNAEGHYAHGRVAQELGKLDRAATAFRAATRADAAHALAWANLGVCLHQSGRLSEALGPMRRASALLPGDGATHRNLGAVLEELGRLDEAQAAYEDATRLAATDWSAWHGYGVVLQKRGRREAAERAYARALEIRPDAVESLGNLAALYAARGDAAGAQALLERALAARPDEPTLLRARDALSGATGREKR